MNEEPASRGAEIPALQGREEVNGHGTPGCYTNGGCRLPECRAAATDYHRQWRAARFAERVEVDGRLVAPVPAEWHGKPATYDNRGCRCVACTAAHTARSERTTS